MKASFKPLSLAIAVSAATAGYVGTVNAQTALTGNSGLGDLAIVPYYTVQEDWTTGVSVINTSASTQVIKVRFRRANDSMDALDFNLVLSPNDVWTGYIEDVRASADVEPIVRLVTSDKSCTVPASIGEDGGVDMPQGTGSFADGAAEGYIEFIGMGATINEEQQIAVDALHDNGVPNDCKAVESNFERYGAVNVIAGAASAADLTAIGVLNSVQSSQGSVAGPYSLNEYQTPGNFMKVSYFIKDSTSGIEFGDNAVMVSNFMDGASMTNSVAAPTNPDGTPQEDLQGYDYPDLRGGAPLSVIAGVAGAASDDQFNVLRTILNSDAMINDWSRNSSGDLFTVNTDWVVTAPGQYAMLELPTYIASLPTGAACGATCDYRDLPLTIVPRVFDREEGSEIIPPGDIVVSPTPANPTPPGTLPNEVNVIQWGTEKVLDSAKVVTLNATFDAEAGWAQIGLIGRAGPQVCQYTALIGDVGDLTCAPARGGVPIVGMAAWAREFGANPDANYGRMIRHSYIISS